jgi:hypothetical protein
MLSNASSILSELVDMAHEYGNMNALKTAIAGKFDPGRLFTLLRNWVSAVW